MTASCLWRVGWVAHVCFSNAWLGEWHGLLLCCHLQRGTAMSLLVLVWYCDLSPLSSPHPLHNHLKMFIGISLLNTSCFLLNKLCFPGKEIQALCSEILVWSGAWGIWGSTWRTCEPGSMQQWCSLGLFPRHEHEVLYSFSFNAGYFFWQVLRLIRDGWAPLFLIQSSCM